MKGRHCRILSICLLAALLALPSIHHVAAQQYIIDGDVFVSGVSEAVSNEFSVSGMLAEPFVVTAVSNDYGINPLLIVVEEPTGTDPPDGAPPVYFLAGNYPNPFNPVTTITYGIEERTPVTLRIYDVSGRLVRTLVDAVQEPGRSYTVTWDGRNAFGHRASSVVYFCRLIAGARTSTRKMVLLR
jgi:hypothetical protein